MKPETATKLFQHDARKLMEVASHFRIREVALLDSRTLTFLVRRAGVALRVVVNGGDRYYVDPTVVEFANPQDPSDRDKKWWPAGVSGISVDERFICAPGFAEGQRRHAAEPSWPVSTRKNTIESLVHTLTHFILKLQPWPEASG